MHIKTFHAFTMQEAIHSIKAELGSDAVILSTKEFRKQGPFARWFSRPLIEVTAAIDRSPSSPKVPTAAPAPKTAPAAPDDSPAPSILPPSEFHETLRGLMRNAGPPDDTFRTAPAASPTSTQGTRRRRALTPQLTRIAAELRTLHRHLMETYPEDTIGTPTSVPVPVTSLYRDLVGRGLSSQTAVRFVRHLHAALSAADLLSSTQLRTALCGLVTEQMTVGGPLMTQSDHKKTVLFLGPSGVGKTTTIAKLAAHYQVEHRRSIALITLDTYRIAAVEQLRLYANTLGIPMEIALTRRDAVTCIRRHHDRDLILVDTGGRNPMDPSYLDELRRLAVLDQPVETHLVLAATTREQDLLATVHRFADFPVDRLLFTKLDETSGVGSLLTVHRQTGIPLSYFGTGQRVPDDLEPATAERLADVLLDGTLHMPAHPTETIRRGVARAAGSEPARTSA